MGVRIDPEKSIYLTASVDPSVYEPNSTDNPSTYTIPPDSSSVHSCNEDDIVDNNLDNWLVIDSTGTTTYINELLLPAHENNNLLDSLTDHNKV